MNTHFCETSCLFHRQNVKLGGFSLHDLRTLGKEAAFLLVDGYEFRDEFFDRFVVLQVLLQTFPKVVTQVDCSCHERE